MEINEKIDTLQEEVVFSLSQIDTRQELARDNFILETGRKIRKFINENKIAKGSAKYRRLRNIFRHVILA